MQKWEYLRLDIDSSLYSSDRKFKYSLNDKSIEESTEGYPSEQPTTWKLLNKLGQEGWELVAVDWKINRYWFKRPQK